ncbi:hypothetical protein ASPWEDRAFT_498638 [Aspergillus wentii DTO 134E9]|uniref:Regulator of phospholipase D SRF1 n=1 Tax=Aspergillus wentii DTO 134E9 TaxID=1073089 RepID=A0A1L9RJW7_ASPWE|nr:uncharacterized protein ASPWEDRAFT_498638 [Aspergillus wentii DTO 134E9]KAI9923822.1 hypothetical protein MW887_008304 [Aspergillus wentii]OJJ35194.1 hypothetical protein ASPWEDRAFT_498638 [Aspergillus wentii DTO 134E9]
MAQDARDSSFPPPPEPESYFDEKLLNAPVAADWAPRTSDLSQTGPNGDARSVEPFRSGISDPSASASRTPEECTVGVGGIDGQRDKERKIRTLPAWIRSVDHNDDEDVSDAAVTDRLLPSQPDDAIVAQHNHSPYSTSRPDRGDHRGDEESGEREVSPRRESRWKTFSRAIAYPRPDGVEEKLVTPDWMDENHGDYTQPWRGRLEQPEDSEDPLRRKRRREIWFRRFHTTLLRSPIVPLIFRLTVWFFSLTALALGGSIQHLSNKDQHPQGPSALMAIVVDAVALVYLVYITFDEYTSKPLGLRSASAKARLILLDIIFIVFDSANLSLAFESLSTVQGSCTLAEVNQEITPKNDKICDRQKALASVLLVALLAWLMTFSVSVLRLVERVTK